jgi:hypothetical protein
MRPPVVHEPEVYRVRGAAVLLPADASWLDASEEHRKFLPGVDQAGV